MDIFDGLNVAEEDAVELRYSTADGTLVVMVSGTRAAGVENYETISAEIRFDGAVFYSKSIFPGPDLKMGGPERFRALAVQEVASSSLQDIVSKYYDENVFSGSDFRHYNMIFGSVNIAVDVVARSFTYDLVEKAEDG